MKKENKILSQFFIITVLVVFIMPGLACKTTTGQAVESQQNPVITIVNNTGYTVNYIFFSETTSGSWGQNRLRSDQVIRNNESVSLQLPHPINRVNQYDFRLVDSDGDEYIKMNVSISVNNIIEFEMSDITLPAITIINNTGYTIFGMFVFELESESIGQNRISSHLLNRQSVTVELPRYLGRTTQYHIVLIDTDGDFYTKANVNVRTNKVIEFTIRDIDFAFRNRIMND